MGFDGIYRMYAKNDNGDYEEMALFNRDGKKLYTMFPSRDGMINQALLGYNRHGYDFEAIGDGRGMPSWYLEKNPDYDTPNEGTWYDYVELRGYRRNSNYSFVDYYSDNEDKRNPIDDFMRIADMYLELFGKWYPKPGEIIIICEMSYQ